MYYNVLILPDGRRVPDRETAIVRTALKRCVCETKQALPGGVCAAMLEVWVLDPEGQLSLAAGDRVQLVRVDSNGEENKVGVFYLEKPERLRENTLVLTGYDAVRLLDRDLTQWLADLQGWPYTLSELAAMVAQACGLTLSTGQLPNGELPVEAFPAIATGRQLMRWICQVCCRFCRATAEGELELAWFTDSGVTLSPTGELFYYRGGLRFDDFVTQQIDGVQLRLADGKSSCLWPQNGAVNPWIITANPILAEATQRSALALETIADQLRSLRYTPCTVTIPASDTLLPGQFVNIQTPGGRVLRACILESSRSGARDTLLGPGESKLSTAVSAGDRAALAALNAAASAVQGQTQQEVFDKLTDGGKAKGIFMRDGQLYINASYLATGVIRSADGTVEIDLANNTVSIYTETGKMTLSAAGLYGYGKDGGRTLVLRPGSGEGTPTMLNSFEANAGLQVIAGMADSTLTLGQAGAYTDIRGKSIRLLGKTVSWSANGDGTYSLTGT